MTITAIGTQSPPEGQINHINWFNSEIVIIGGIEMSMTRIFPSPIDNDTSEMITDFRKELLSPHDDYRKESLFEVIINNFGFVIIGLMFVGALIWTILMCG
jgi:hypothetical protein